MGHYDLADEPGPSKAITGTPQSQKSGKGKYPAKGPIKRKIKEFRLRVVGLTKMSSKMPVGSLMQAMMKTVWMRENSFADEVTRKICETFSWDHDTSTIQYMYANGRYLRKASLEDVENADSWDSEAIRALMGSGCLYVVRQVREDQDVEVDTSSACAHDADDNIQLLPDVPSNSKVL